MRSSTIGIVVAGTLLVATGGVVAGLLTRDGPGTNPARWSTETLTADGAVALPSSLHLALAGCPGFTISSPVPDDGRTPSGAGTHLVRLAPDHLTVWVCLGTVDETGGARSAVVHQLGVHDDVRSFAPALVSAPFGEAARVDRAFGPDALPRLTDWLVDHRGYTYAVGYLHPSGDQQHYETVEAMIASAVWDE